MLIFDFRQIGDKLFSIRKKEGLTQSDVAEIAGLSERTYADIERGTVNMRMGTLLKICEALHITPDEVLTKENEIPMNFDEVLEKLSLCSQNERETAIKLLSVYLDSLNKNL